MSKAISLYLYIFVIFSFFGWILEFLFRSLKAKRIINPGFLKGPYLPIYGAVCLCISFVSLHIGEDAIFRKIIFYFLITTGVEFITGFALEKLFHIRLWDYSKARFSIKGHICLTYSLCWLILAFGFDYLLLPLARSFYTLNPWISLFVIVLAFLMFIDFIIKSLSLYVQKKHGKAVPCDEEWQRDFDQISEPLLKEPQVAELAKYPHHRIISRLDHCRDVAWESYKIARRFSLDCEMTVRGAILHDLFFYEWLTEGPRLHGFRHPRICLENARNVTTLSAKEEDIIIKHMWPLTWPLPSYPESWIVCLVDTYCTIKDYMKLRPSRS